MDGLRKHSRPLAVFLSAGFFLLLLFSYIPIVYAHFHLKQYMRFPGDGGTLLKGVMAAALCGVLLLMKRPRQMELTELIWTVIFCLSFVPELILFIFSEGFSYSGIPFFYALLLLSIGRMNEALPIRPAAPARACLYRHRYGILLSLSCLGLLVFFVGFGLRIDPRLLLMGDVYGARGAFLAQATLLQGYLKNPLLRVILPLLMLVSLEKKKYLAVLIAALGAVYLYLVTAVKTDLVGFGLIFFFWLIRKVPCKSLILLLGLNLTALISIGQYAVTGSVSLYEFFLRRVVFVPAMLNRVYLMTFHDQPLFWSPEATDRLLQGTGLPSVQRYVGEVILQTKGVNASAGIVTDALINGGYAALFLPLSLMLVFAALLHHGHYPPAYSGIPLLFVFIMNSAFLGPLLLTHGLAAFLASAFLLVIPAPPGPKDSVAGAKPDTPGQHPDKMPRPLSD